MPVIEAFLIVPPLRVRVESLTEIEPAVNVPLLTATDCPLLMLAAPVTERLPEFRTRLAELTVKLLIETVFVGPLIVVPDAAFNVTSSLRPGTTPVLQFSATPQL